MERDFTLINKVAQFVLNSRQSKYLKLYKGADMRDEKKITRMLKTSRATGEGEDWIFSLVPICIAFVFYIMFIITTDLENKGLFIAVGAAAGMIGLQSYWIVRGWRSDHGSTVLMGVIGIFITLGLFNMYVSFS